MRNPIRLLSGVIVGAVSLAAWIGVPSRAEAGIEACGDIHVEAEAQCELVVEGGCVVQCEPVRFEAACAAELQAECSGQCNAEASVDCAVDCSAECMADCDVEPGSFDCQGSCMADCGGECQARCGTGDSECVASCDASCSASCEGKCEVVPPEASCEAKCEASCDGSCEAEANIDCQVDCQASGYVECKADLQGGCEADCQRPEGALFCDGQYVDYGNNLEECVAALEAALDIEVEGYAEAECEGGECQAEAGGSLSCAIEPDERSRGLALGLVVLVMTGMTVMQRRYAH